MASFPRVICLCVMVLVGLTGCITPAKRAREHPADFRRLTSVDQQLVLRGRVRTGLGRDGVLIAWGVPDEKTTGNRGQDGKDKSEIEVWTYRGQATTHAAIGSYDQWQPGRSLVQPGAARWISPGYGFGGSGYEGWLLHSPRVQYTDSYVRRAAFVNGKLAEYKTWYGEYSPLP